MISGAADPARARAGDGGGRASISIRRDDGLALLFTPPFDQTPLDPGYIKGYPPGIRENGGQYTHAAAVVGHRASRCSARATRPASCSPCSIRSTTRARAPDVQRYKVEPYVVAADVYSVAPHVGRGGWTWYTGSAGWMYRAGIESILGFRLQGAPLLLDPCIPTAWPRFEITFKYRSARYDITVENPRGVSRGIASATLDGNATSKRPRPLAPRG